MWGGKDGPLYNDHKEIQSVDDRQPGPKYHKATGSFYLLWIGINKSFFVKFFIMPELQEVKL